MRNITGCREQRHWTHQMPGGGRIFSSARLQEAALPCPACPASAASDVWEDAFSDRSAWFQWECCSGKNTVRQTFVLLGCGQWFWYHFQRKHDLCSRTVHPLLSVHLLLLYTFPSYSPHDIFEPINWKSLTVLMIIRVQLVVQKLAERRNMNEFPCWGDTGRVQPWQQLCLICAHPAVPVGLAVLWPQCSTWKKLVYWNGRAWEAQATNL